MSNVKDALLNYLIGKYIADGDGDFAAGSALPSNKSIFDAAREFGSGYLATKYYADLTGYDSEAIFEVTGDVMVQVIGVVSGAITCGSATTVLNVGTTEAPTAILPAAIMNGTLFANTDVWVDATPAVDCEIMPSNNWFIVSHSHIILFRDVDDIAGGAITFYCFWRPLSSDGNVVAS